MTNLVRLVVAVTMLACSGCIVGTPEDVSSDPRFARYVGETYRSTVDLLAIGVTLDQNYRTGIDVIDLVPPPGFGGPEVKGRGTVKAGATLKVVAVTRLRFTSWWSDGYSFVVEGATCEICSKARVMVDVKEASDRLAMPGYFTRVEGSP